MSQDWEPFDHFDQQLDRFFEAQRADALRPEDFQAMERELRVDPALRRRYRARVRLEEALSARFAEPADMLLPFEAESPRPWYRRATTAWLAAAAMVAVLLAVNISSRDPLPATVATLESSSRASWQLPPALTVEGNLPPGEVRLDSGMAHFRFDSGALVVLEGPATLIIESAMRAKLVEGNALVDVPDEAHGFVIALPHGETVDLGTRFSLSVSGEVSTCEVLEGSVIMRHERSLREELLDSGQVMIMDGRGIAPLGYRPSMSFAPGAAESVSLRTTAEATVVSSNRRDDQALDDRMLLVKYEPGSMMQRRALFNIDLRGIRADRITSARLNLNLVPSGLGFAAYVPETLTFAVYGISDESLENWDTVDPQWEDAPGYVAGDDSAINPAAVTLLETFTIDRGQQRGRITLDSKALLDFLRNDSTGTAGFLIVRETGGTDNYSLVHAFASSLHPEASGPSLEITTLD